MAAFNTKYNVGDKVYFNENKVVYHNTSCPDENMLAGEIVAIFIISKTRWDYQADIYYVVNHHDVMYKVHELYIAGYQ